MIEQSQSVYRIVEKGTNKNLKKGYYYYLDNLHKDHIEVYDSYGECKHVLNLDGSKNVEKSRLAKGRTIKVK